MEHYIFYMAGWIAASVIAAVLAILDRRESTLLNGNYLAFILVPWKAVTFCIAAVGMVLIAPYTGDPTWDYVDAAVMALLTYLTAPWSVGIFFRRTKNQAPWRDVYIAVCLLLFSSSWFYDGYILIRDGVYPQSWLQNLIISPTLYISGGLFWSLSWTKDEGIKFAFQRDDWYERPDETRISRIVWLMIPFMFFAVFSILWFVGEEIRQVLKGLF